MRLVLHSLAALALVAAAPALAQTPAGDGATDPVVLAPGHPDLTTDGLALETETVAVRVTDPRPTVYGTLTTEAERSGDAVTLTTDADVSEAGLRYSSTVTFAWPSLAPVSRDFSQGNVTAHTDYDGQAVTGTWARGEWAPLPFDIALPRPVFQPEVLPILARALPLEAGYTAVVPTFTAERRLRDYTLSVVGEEEVTLADGSAVTAWAVEETSEGRGSRTRRYFVDGATRALVAFTTTAGRDATIISEPVTDEMLASLEADAALPTVELRPGLERLQTDALQSYSQDYVIRVVEPVQQDAGTQSRTVTVDRAAGTVRAESQVEIAMAGQRTSETVEAAFPSLAPISSRVDANGTVIDLAFSDNAVSGTRTEAGGDPEPVDLMLEEPAYDASWLFEIVRLLPFEEDYRATLHTTAAGELADLTLAVLDQEEVDGQTAWIVEARPEEGPATEFAVADGTRELLRVRLRPQAGVVVDIVPVADEAGM